MSATLLLSRARLFTDSRTPRSPDFRKCST